MDIRRYFIVNIGVNLQEIINCKFLILPLHTQLKFTCSKSPIETIEKGEICSKLKILITPQRRQRRCSGVFIVNFEQISVLSLMFVLVILNN